MAKRIKKVFSNYDQVLHLWANESQDDARSRNVYFVGDTCYSYGRHYPLGKITTFKGVKVACINTTGYSSTTSKHIHSAKSAANHLPTIGTGYDFNIEQGLAKTRESLIFSLEKELRGRVYSYINGPNFQDSYVTKSIDNFNNLIRKLKVYSKFKIMVSEDYKRKYTAHVTKCLARQKERDKVKELNRKIERQKQIEQAKLDLVSWKTGGAFTSSLYSLPFQLLRINGDKIETTNRAEVPLQDGLLLLKAVVSGKAVSGMGVGSFKFDKLEDDTVYIGCHKIKLDEARLVLGHLI